MDDDNEEIDTGNGPEPIIAPDDVKSATGWLSLIKVAEKAFDTWQSKCDSIDRQYANLEKLASHVRDREFQMFWANVQILGPSIYARPPIPVVTPKFKNSVSMQALPPMLQELQSRTHKVSQIASELLERSLIVTFDNQDLDGTMRAIRDDLNVVGRGVPWITYETKSDAPGSLGQRTCIEHVHRRDFLHDPARQWPDVDWVAKRSWLTRGEARKRFLKYSGNVYKDAAYEVRKDEITGETDNRLKAGFWELWSRSKNRVVWVSEGCDKLLDEGKPHLELEGFFPCPRPAFGTTQRSTLVPVPDYVFYKDQLEEINEYTARISALAEGLRLKGFYPGGASELSDAIEAAFKKSSDNAILIPVSNWNMAGANAKDMVLWLPLDEVASTIVRLIELRKQTIDDIYQIMGLSDIMRGSTEASETLGAQELKSQYGSIRIRDKRDELVRIARDVTRICAEIMSENFTAKSLLDMSQMQIPTKDDISKQVAEFKAQYTAQLTEAQNDPELMAQAEAEPEKAQQVIAQAKQQVTQQIAEAKDTITIDEVMKFLRDNRTRAFALDIETDSTVAPDENAQKQRATEYISGMSGLLRDGVSAVQSVPQIAPIISQIIRYANSQFRVGREFEGVIEEFTDQMKAMAAAPKNEGPSPEQIKAQSDAQRAQLDAQKMQADAQLAQAGLQLETERAKAEATLEQAKMQADQQAEQTRMQLDQMQMQMEAQATTDKIEADKWKAQLDAVTKIKVAMISAKTDMERVSLEAELEAMLGIQSHEYDMELKAIDQQHQSSMREMDHEQDRERASEETGS